MQLNNLDPLLLAISAGVISTSLRLSEGMTRPLPTLLVFSAYALEALLSKVVLSIPLGITYALERIGTW